MPAATPYVLETPKVGAGTKWSLLHSRNALGTIDEMEIDEPARGEWDEGGEKTLRAGSALSPPDSCSPLRTSIRIGGRML